MTGVQTCALPIYLHEEDLLETCTVVAAGMVELVRLQDAGFAYVKP